MKSSFYRITLDDIRISLKDLSAILWILSYVVLLPLTATFKYTKQTTTEGVIIEAAAFILPSVVLYAFYLVFRRFGAEATPKTKNIMITIALAWLIMAFVGSLPFIARNTLNPLDAFFESMSGWTTTGFTMIRNLENTPRDIILFRSIMQGVGGLGVISLGMMVMLQGTSLATGYSDVGIQKIKPGIRHTIMETWKIYGVYIILGAVLLYLAGMNPFDAVNHSMTAIASGGFSTHSDIGYYNSIQIELTLLFLILLGTTSFILHHRLFNGDWTALKSDEFKYYITIMAASTCIIGASIYGKHIPGVDTYSVPDILRKTGFHVISGMSTCGYNTIDFGKWPDFAKTFMMVLIYIGGMNASTAGGIRMIRFVILVKAIHYSLKKLVLPKTAMVMIKVDGRALKEDIIAVVGYSAAYLGVCVALAAVLMQCGYSATDSMSTIMSAMGNDGLGVVSGESWHNMPAIGKINIIFAMWIGRIEIYPGLLLLRAVLNRLSLI